MITDNLTAAAVDLDGLLAQAGLFITSDAIDMEVAHRLHRRVPVGAWTYLASELPAFRAEVRSYLAHESVEELYDTHLDPMARLELTCRKEEVSRRLDGMASQLWTAGSRRAA